MSRVFTLPDLGEGLTEAEIVEWLVEESTAVTVDQHVVVVETAKATVELPCPYAGTVATRHGAPGDVIAVGAPLVTIAVDGEAAASAAQGNSVSTAGDRGPAYAGSEGAGDGGSGNVLIGYGTGGERTRRPRARRDAERAQRSEAPVEQAAPQPIADPAEAPRVISPLVRKLAQQHGLDLARLTPAYGKVLRRKDIDDAIALGSRATDTGDERIPLTGVRRAIADKLSQSRREIPDATTWVDVDGTALVRTRDELRAAGVEKVGLLALLARVSVVGLQRFPELNAEVDMASQEIVRHRAIHLGFAVQSPRGLVVPVVRNAGELTTSQLGAKLAELTAKAREGTLQPAELTGGTFTLNNYGVFGVDGSTPILNHPQAAMLGVGRLLDRPWVVDGELTVRTITQLSFTFDHRVCDGGSAGGFLRYVADLIEAPVRLLGEL
ncbi:2-oxo acid dehydrogenase subunit E2 [Calidifontibacter sp. DB0510]|uniref:Dihydrolipoamide acetyltransferase component of pyruvate dehydrogenase complex n=1 Tax=Metallococcus carri TaxID=1656884 RepID=A0A967B2D5_9MICO|nr:dihydrolipoamide acetyltransferase family protein [Metallococcus carri]NHN57038.1 2-oxo acid dehydrogenase subunit E2 [Metallococcus carri]NOP39093.1 2-oxo acid dehydrogenase subunit E2 [Calidifontibacter sp. DB2511S]